MLAQSNILTRKLYQSWQVLTEITHCEKLTDEKNCKKTIPKEYKRIVKMISDLRISQKYKTLKLLRYKI